MSERILKALMQLFAIIAKGDHATEANADKGRSVVRLFLKQQLNARLVDDYLKLFDKFLDSYQKDGSTKKRTSVNSVKVLRICTEINEELEQNQKIIVLVRLLEFIYSNNSVTNQELEFLNTVAETFNIIPEEYKTIKNFIESRLSSDVEDSSQLILISNVKLPVPQSIKQNILDGMEGTIKILRVPSVGIYFMRYYGHGSFLLNGQLIQNNLAYIFSEGSSIRNNKIQTIYHSDIVSSYLNDGSTAKIIFKAIDLQYRFEKSKGGIHPVNFTEESGKLIGIMGGSGSGKSTLLNLLNGNIKPTQGSVTINGIDIHKDSKKIEGVIGYVAQDDLLIEELTVYENLFFNAQLCFGNLSETETRSIVDNLLISIGLAETKNLKVGNPIDKTISGGQRKRLNIALELIREPSILFVDEPTSGLSSRDSENIMDLLKELTLKGKLIFVVIHQPSSDIFKMFDRLILFDQGGFPIYYGNPVDSIEYFRKIVQHVNSSESECITCGNVNPEQIFSIIEARIVDEFGNLTNSRKISPSEWNNYYTEGFASKNFEEEKFDDIPTSTFKIPNKLKQFFVFIKRDVLSKISNKQYLLINLLEAPALAMILAFFLKFFTPESAVGSNYIFRQNENIPQFLFISVIVALFIGLTVSSEEIIRDKLILKRERFLNLSKGSYLFSKISIMFFLSAIQMLLFVLVGNYILEIRDMNLSNWLLLFSTSCFANMLGLNISASFNSAKVIYIFIPILIIPQLLFSGIIVKFDKLHPLFSSQSGVPLIGNIMASRWAYEALAVSQYKCNKYEKKFYKFDKRKKFSNWKKDYWVTDLRNRMADVDRYKSDPAKEKIVKYNLLLIKNEIGKEMQFVKNIKLKSIEKLNFKQVDKQTVREVLQYLEYINEHYKTVFNKAEKEKENLVYEMTKNDSLNKEYMALLNNYQNESLEKFVTNRNDVTFISDYKGSLIQKKDPIYLEPYFASFFDAHFYAPSKKLFGNFIDTYFANLMVIWGMSLLLFFTLYFNFINKLLGALSIIFEKLNIKKGKYKQVTSSNSIIKK
jgi:ABC transport system ATP-binding/permease protein